MLVSLIIWVVLGAVVGAIATKFVNTRGDSPLLGIGAAVAGAVVLGFAYRLASGNPEAWGVFALLFAVIGAALGAAAYHLIRSRSISRDRQTVRSSY
jgi:uncharacterized membrane protein YeaQ/YmgE (transglycosylase-associated protein family)